jgi:hypothetical protein
MPDSTKQYGVSTWGRPTTEEIKLPSDPNALIKVKRLDLQMLVASGMVDELDALSGIMEEKVVGPARGKKPADRQAKKLTKKQQEAAERAEALSFFKGGQAENLMRLLGRMLPVIIQEPHVESCYEQVTRGGKTIWALIPDEDREPGVIYSDTIPLQDQMHILKWAMEGMDLDEMASFRGQRESDLVNVESESGVSGEAE